MDNLKWKRQKQDTRTVYPIAILMSLQIYNSRIYSTIVGACEQGEGWRGPSAGRYKIQIRTLIEVT